ncbi:MAG: aminoglycoside phosphotransferase family protein [Solirubrobacteraceae bacterium]
MDSLSSPGEPTLISALENALTGVGLGTPVKNVRREDNVYESSHRSEVLVCSLASGAELRLLGKVGPSVDQDHWGLVRGLAYEAAVYRQVLVDEDPTPHFYGSYDDPRSGRTWLFLEYLGEGWQLDLGPEDAIVEAARMIGELHRRAAPKLGAESPSVLNRYDGRYYENCLRNVGPLVEKWRPRLPGLDQLVAGFQREFGVLLSAPQTIVHGELTPHNVVWAYDRPYIVDWEEAAIGAGEIDLASLTDEWDEDLVSLATAAYLQSRWPEGPPHDFPRALRAARLCWLFRRLADADGADTEEGIDWLAERFEEANLP